MTRKEVSALQLLIRLLQEHLGHANIGITLDTYSHVLLGLQEAAAERFDKLLNESSFGKSNVSKMLANAEDLASSPYISRIFGTLIKSHQAGLCRGASSRRYHYAW